MPIQNVDNAATMFAGYVGPAYDVGGLAFFGVNPGGGKDNSVPHSDDERFYTLLRGFRAASPATLSTCFEAINAAFPPIVESWNLWRIFEPALEAFGAQLSQVCYLNAVPFRTRENKAPPKSARDTAWLKCTAPVLVVLRPRTWVALGKAAGDILATAEGSEKPGEFYVVPRTNGDRYLSPEAKQVLQSIRYQRGT